MRSPVVQGSTLRYRVVVADDMIQAVPASPGTVFLSYAREDIELARRLVAHLKPAASAKGLEIWWDHEIPAGSEWVPEIARALENSVVAIVLVTVNTLDSSYIRTVEVPEFVRRGIPVMWVQGQSCDWSVWAELTKFQNLQDGDTPLLSGGDDTALLDARLTAVSKRFARDLPKFEPASSAFTAEGVATSEMQSVRPARIVAGVGALLVMVLILAGILRWASQGEDGPTQPSTSTADEAMVAVPNVYGRASDEAMRTLNDKGFRTGKSLICSTKPLQTVVEVRTENGSGRYRLVIDESGVLVSNLKAGSYLWIYSSNGNGC